MVAIEYIDKNNAARLLEEMIRGVERAFDIHIIIHDHKGLLKLPDGGSILPERNIHRSACCIWKAQLVENRSKCMDHCRDYAMRKSSRQKNPWQSQCWRGLAEVVVPIYRGDGHLGTLFGGSFRLPGMKLNGFPQEYRELYEATPLWDDLRAREIGLLLQTVGNGLLQLADRIYEESLEEFGRAGIIRRYINHSIDCDLKLSDLALHLGLSESRTGHLVRECFDMTFAALLNEEKIRRSKALMAEKSLSMAEIAERVGIANEFYFSRIFKKVTGIPPGAFRKKLLKTKPVEY